VGLTILANPIRRRSRRNVGILGGVVIIGLIAAAAVGLQLRRKRRAAQDQQLLASGSDVLVPPDLFDADQIATG
jgi:hypothetical protein